MITQVLLTDMYQLTMMQGLFTQQKHRIRCVFDRFYRTNPFQGAYLAVKEILCKTGLSVSPG